MIIDLALPASARVPVPAVRMPPVPVQVGGDGLSMQRWLAAYKDAMFRWAIALAGTPPMGSDLAARRTFAETAVALQRLEGPTRVVSWLFGESLLAAQRHADHGVLPEALLAGLPPELRAILRLVARGDLRAEEAWALLPQHMGFVRRSLVKTRLSPLHARPAR